MNRHSFINSIPAEQYIPFLRIYYTLEWIEKSIISAEYPKIPNIESLEDFRPSSLAPSISLTSRLFYDTHSWGRDWQPPNNENSSIQNHKLAYHDISSYFNNLTLPTPLSTFCTNHLRHVDLVMNRYPEIGNDLTLFNQIKKEESGTKNRLAYYDSLEDLIWRKVEFFGLNDLELITDNILYDLPRFYIEAIDVRDNSKNSKSYDFDSTIQSLESTLEFSTITSRYYHQLGCVILFQNFDRFSSEDKQQITRFCAPLHARFKVVSQILEAQHLHLSRYRRLYHGLGHWPFDGDFVSLAESSIKRVYSLLADVYGLIANEFKSINLN